jgi:hypothetical protein
VEGRRDRPKQTFGGSEVFHSVPFTGVYWYNVSCVELTFSSVCCCWREARLEATIILLSSLLFKNLFLMSNKYSMSL